MAYWLGVSDSTYLGGNDVSHNSLEFSCSFCLSLLLQCNLFTELPRVVCHIVFVFRLVFCLVFLFGRNFPQLLDNNNRKYSRGLSWNYSEKWGARKHDFFTFTFNTYCCHRISNIFSNTISRFSSIFFKFYFRAMKKFIFYFRASEPLRFSLFSSFIIRFSFHFSVSPWICCSCVPFGRGFLPFRLFFTDC